MPSTNPSSLTLGFRRAEIAGFWIVAVSGGAVALVLFALAIGARLPLAWAAASPAILLPAVVWSQWLDLGVRVWNKLASVVAAALRRYVLRVTYFVTVAAVGSAGASRDVVSNPSARSRWIRRPMTANASAEQDLLALTRGAGQGWQIVLLPVIGLLSLLRTDDQESGPPSSTYTLY